MVSAEKAYPGAFKLPSGANIVVVKVGVSAKTAAPVPVSSESVFLRLAEVQVLVSTLLPSVQMNLLGVRSENVMEPEVVMPVAAVIAPALLIVKAFAPTLNLEVGLAVPIPTLPLPSTVKSVVCVVEATVKSGSVPGFCVVVETERVEKGDVVPIPKRPTVLIRPASA